MAGALQKNWFAFSTGRGGLASAPRLSGTAGMGRRAARRFSQFRRGGVGEGGAENLWDRNKRGSNLSILIYMWFSSTFVVSRNFFKDSLSSKSISGSLTVSLDFSIKSFFMGP